MVHCVRNMMAHSDAREGKWRGNWRMEWVASILTRPRNVVYPAFLTLMRTPRLPAVSRLNWRPHRFKWTSPFRRKTKCGFCACAIRFRTSSASLPMFAAFISQTTVMFHMHRDYTGRTVQGTVNGSCLQLWICNYVCMYCHLLMTKTLTLTVWEGVSVKNIDISMLNVGIYLNSTQPNIYLTGTHPLRVTNIYRSVPPGPRS